MAYTKQTWKDGTGGGATPLTAARLNHIEDGISDASNTKKVNVTSLTPEFKLYRSNKPVVLRKCGNIVYMAGETAPTATISAGLGTHLMFTIPEEFRPSEPVYAICQGSSTRIWNLVVYAEGGVAMERYRGGDAYVDVTSSNWLPFNATWIVDQEIIIITLYPKRINRVKIELSEGGDCMAWIDVKDYLAASHPAVEAADYVVAEGKSGNWYYAKYNSGLAMCWATLDMGTVNYNSTYGDNFYTTLNITFPFPFIGVPQTMIHMIINKGLYSTHISSINNTTAYIQVWSQNLKNEPTKMQVVLFGQWK